MTSAKTELNAGIWENGWSDETTTEYDRMRESIERSLGVEGAGRCKAAENDVRSVLQS